jgi:hypothetical protein
LTRVQINPNASASVNPVVARFNAATGARTGSNTATDSRALAFDGTRMWVVNRTSNALTPIRACDGTVTAKPILSPVSPENAAFDTVNFWVLVPATHTVSVR